MCVCVCVFISFFFFVVAVVEGRCLFSFLKFLDVTPFVNLSSVRPPLRLAAAAGDAASDRWGWEGGGGLPELPKRPGVGAAGLRLPCGGLLPAAGVPARPRAALDVLHAGTASADGGRSAGHRHT